MSESAPARKAKIAVIDDDRFIRYLLDLHLRKAGYEVFTTDEPFGVPLRKAFAARQRLP